MIRHPRNLFWLIPVLLFVTSPLWKPSLSSFLTPRGNYDAPTPQVEEDRPRRFIMQDVSITLYSAGKTEWVIDAEEAFTASSDREIGMSGVEARYRGEDREKTHITSSRGMYAVDEQHLILIDDVVILQPESRQEMYTDLLHYYNEGKKVVCPGWVRLMGPDFTISAGRLDYDLVSNAYDFGGRVKVELTRTGLGTGTGT